MTESPVVLFDISGVLIELGGMPDFIRWTGKTAEDIGSLWLESESVRSFERGFIDFETFHKCFVEEWNVEISYSELRSHFELWVQQAFPGTNELLSELGTKYELACLANTNCIQWPVVKSTIEIDRHFKNQFASHEIGKVKPDDEAFEYVLEELGVSPDQVVFLDDSNTNVAAALRLGINALQVKGTDSVREALSEIGII